MAAGNVSRQRVQVRYISLGSAFKVGLVLSALLFSIFGLIFIVSAGALGSILGSAMDTSQRQLLGGMGAGLVGGIIGYVIGIVVYGIIGGIAFTINAFFYNVVAGIVGGIEIDLS